MGVLSGGEVGCIKSHYNVLSNCKSKFCLVLEDDFQLCENFDVELDKCLNELPDNFQALWLGGVVVGVKKDYSKHLYQIKGTTGTYGYLVNMEFANDFLTVLKKESKLCDWLMSTAFERVFRSKKNLVTHRAGYSEIKGKEVKYKQ